MEEIEKDGEESFDSVNDLFADFERRDKIWEKKHPFRAKTRKFLDERFPSGIAGGMRAYYALQRPWKIFDYWKYEIIHAYQRVSRGWDDTAVWSIDYYLADLIPQLVKSLKENGNGLPGFAFEGLESNEEGSYTDEQWKIASARWDKVLDEIAEGFESWKKFDEKVLHPEDYEKDEDYQKFLKAMDLLKEHWGSFWD